MNTRLPRLLACSLCASLVISPASAATQSDMPKGTDPARLTYHAKALEDMGYREEAAKLYGNACRWGDQPACQALRALEKAGPTKARPAPGASRRAPSRPVSQTGPAAPVRPVEAKASTPLQLKPSTESTPRAEKSAVAVPRAPLSKEAVRDENALLAALPPAARNQRDACLTGDGLACKRLGELYIAGAEGVERNYAESVRWYERARRLGVDVPVLEKRSAGR